MKKEEKAEVMVGGLLPLPLSDKLSLWATYKSLSKTKAVHLIIQEHMDAAPDIPTMIETIAQNICDVWAKDEDHRPWNIYLAEVRRVLSKKLPPLFLDEVLRAVAKRRR